MAAIGQVEMEALKKQCEGLEYRTGAKAHLEIGGGGMGLANMRSRAEEFGGIFVVAS